MHINIQIYIICIQYALQREWFKILHYATFNVKLVYLYHLITYFRNNYILLQIYKDKVSLTPSKLFDIHNTSISTVCPVMKKCFVKGWIRNRDCIKCETWKTCGQQKCNSITQSETWRATLLVTAFRTSRHTNCLGPNIPN